jgi:putative DNA primase/helicase
VGLEKGNLLNHIPNLYITKQVSTNYNPEAKCPLWMKFLKEITCGDKELQEYLQMAVGYSATGYTSEQVLFYIIGNRGMNGKSLFLTTIQKVLGDYAASARSNIFTSKNDSSIEHSLADLFGARFVTLIETGNEVINEVVLKKITGEDILPARYLYQEGFNFSPTWKIWVASNEMLSLKEAGDATFRRIRVIPFNADFYQTYDNQLSEKFKNEYEGILTWIIQGAVKWFNNGKQLFVPDVVELETVKYRDDQDSRHMFLHRCTEFDLNSEVGLETMYEEYTKYCRLINIVPSTKISLGKIIFGDRHADKGHLKDGSRCWKGIRILSDKERKQKMRINTSVGRFLVGKQLKNNE